MHKKFKTQTSFLKQKFTLCVLDLYITFVLKMEEIKSSIIIVTLTLRKSVFNKVNE